MNEPISRSDFFSKIFTPTESRKAAELEEQNTPMDYAQSLHLVRRLCVVVDLAFVNSLVGKTPRQAVDLMLANIPAKQNPTPPYWQDDSFPDPNKVAGAVTSNIEKHREQNRELQHLWLDLIRKDTNSPLEKLVFFWHGHFTTQYNTCNVIRAQLMSRQLQLFRELALGGFEEFLNRVTLDGAMLLYLNGNENRNEAPNENYARELMELYSTGIGQYTEEDVRAGARILTGWRINPYKNDQPILKPFLQSGYFDTKEKTFMGTTFKVDYEITEENVRKNSIEKLIKTLLTKRADAVAEFITTKLYRFYVYSKPSVTENNFIKLLATNFKNSGFNLKELFISLITSTHFFDKTNIGIQVVSPLESFVNWGGQFPEETPQLNSYMRELGLDLMNPPNVAGWKGYRSWVTTKSLPLTIKFTQLTLEKQNSSGLWAWAQKFPENTDSYKITEQICQFLLGRKPPEKRIESLMGSLLGSAPYYEWPEITKNAENAGLRVKVLLKEIVRTPEFYLR